MLVGMYILLIHHDDQNRLSNRVFRSTLLYSQPICNDNISNMCEVTNIIQISYFHMLGLLSCFNTCYLIGIPRDSKTLSLLGPSLVQMLSFKSPVCRMTCGTQIRSNLERLLIPHMGSRDAFAVFVVWNVFFSDITIFFTRTRNKDFDIIFSRESHTL